MAKVVRGDQDENVGAILKALETYEKEFSGSDAAIYRQNPGVIRVRIIDDRFAGMPRSRRHDEVWQFLTQHLGEDLMAEIAALLLLPTSELRSSLANLEFEDPLPSRL
jgi:stress-induced morphogen